MLSSYPSVLLCYPKTNAWLRAMNARWRKHAQQLLITPTMLCAVWRTDRMIKQLMAAGYALVDIDEWNFVFIQRRPLASAGA